MEIIKMWNFRNVPKETIKAITAYCKVKGLTRSGYLQTDPRIKKYLNK